MKYRAKLFLSFTILVFICTTFALLIVYGESSRLLNKHIKGQLLSITVTAAAAINGNQVEKINEENYKKTQASEEVIKELRQIRNTNRRDDIYIEYMYIIKPKDNAPNFIYVLDTEVNPDRSYTFGEFFPTQEELFQSYSQPFVSSKVSYDHWGRWMSAFAPIYNSEGDIVATLGTDISANHIKNSLKALIYYGIAALVVSILISIMIAHLLSKLVTNSLNLLCDAVEEIGDGNLKARAHLDTNDEFDELSVAINSMARGLEERERLKLGFARYVSQYVLEKIIKSDTQTKLEGERRKVTIFFSDIRHFTSLSEHLDPEVVVSILNQYFERMIEVIFAHNGTLDKFIGDGIMVEFGAPLEDEEQEIHAIRAAIHMQQEIKKLCEKWKNDGLPELAVGMGIHTGLAIVGNIGSDIRMEYTAIGDAVNVASRLEQLTKKHDAKILISKDTYDKVSTTDEFGLESLGMVDLTGREQQIEIFKVAYDESKEYVSFKEHSSFLPKEPSPA